MSSISRFPPEIWAQVGIFLICPQKELGTLNKVASYAVLKHIPYRLFVENRYGISGLQNFVGADENIYWFKNLAVVKDPKDIALSILSGIFSQEAFSKILAPVIRSLLQIPSLFSTGVFGYRHVTVLILKLFNAEAYDEIIAIFKLCPDFISSSFRHTNVDMWKKLIRHVFSCSSENNPELLNESVATYNFIIQKTKSMDEVALILYCCVLENVPMNIYIDSIRDCFPEVLKVVYDRQKKLRDEESDRVYETLVHCLDHYHAKLLDNANNDEEISAKIENYRIILKIGFKPKIEENFYELEIENKYFDPQTLRKFSIFSLFSGRLELFKSLFHYERSGKLQEDEQFDFSQGYFADFVYSLQSYEFLSNQGKKSLLNNPNFFNQFRRPYDAVRINFDEDKILTITFKRAIECVHPLPEIFEYAIDTKLESISAHQVLKVIMFSNITLVTEEEFIIFFQSILDCPYLAEGLEKTQSNPIDTTMCILEKFGQSKELYDLAIKSGLKFKFERQAVSLLFKKDIVGAGFIAPCDDVMDFLPLLIYRTQIRNFENFVGKSIADILSIDLVSDLKHSPLHHYYDIRNVLHHWLNGPHRKRLLMLDIPEYRRKLAKEVCTIDSEFLLTGLEPENLQQQQEQQQGLD